MVPARFIHHCSLRWSDLDAYGHVNNARFLTLYEEARVALVFAGAGADGVDSFADGLVVARQEIDYLRPVGYPLGPEVKPPPSVRIEMWVEEVRSSRFTICYELFDGEVLASRARSMMVPFDLVRQRSRRLTEEEQAFLAPYVVASPSTGGLR
ncbi:MAG TPA: thioesterase family protein [Micromonospora sp.]|nr:thioesterase family protein [Micromonospora sp.]